MTEVFIAGQSVFPEGGFVEIIRSINVLLEPDKRSSEYTRTVNIKGTKEADAIFMAQFDVNFNAGNVGFDPTRKAPLVVYENTIEVMRGYCQLTDVVIIDEVNHTYQCVFYGVVRDLFSVIGDKKLNDIDFSDLDHAYNIASITASWSAPVGVGYVYPMVNYGWFTPTVMAVQDFRPWIYCKEIFNRIMSEAGFEYTSNFINGSVFERLIYNGDVNPELTQAAIAASNVQVDRITSAQTIAAVPALVQFNNTIDDPNTQWSGSPDFRIIAGSSGIHNIDLFLSVAFRNTGGNLTGNHLGVATFRLTIRDAGNNIRKEWQFDITDTFGNLNTNASHTTQGSISVDFDLLATDYVDVRLIFGNIFNVRSNGSTGNRVRNIADTDMEVLINTTSQLNFRRNGTILGIGDNYDVGYYAAGTMLQRDWLMGIVKMFNLYIEPQPNGTLLIEPREQFYTNDVIDLTPNLAVDREFTIKPLELAKYKKYKYQYKEGKDLFGIQHAQTYDGEPYGSTEIEIDNDFAKDTKMVQLPFSLPCMSIDTVTAASNSNRVVPVLLNEKDSAKYKGSEIGKILVWGGVRGTLSPWIFFGETTFRTGYPYAGQLDSLDTPTIDIAFDIPPEIYWKREGRNDVSLITNGGLYQQYHEQEIEELTNKNSKIVECYVAINEAEYQSLSFRKLIFIRNAYYRLQEINYAGSEQLSQLTLLKLNAFAKQSGVPDDYFFDNINKDQPVSTVRSRGNFIDRASDGIAVLGVDHTVIGRVSGVLIFGGKDNIVSSDNVAVINLSEQENPFPNTVNIGFNGDEYTGDAEYTGKEGSPFYAIFTLTANANYDLAFDPSQMGKVIKVSNQGPHQVHVRENGSDVAVVTGSAEFYHTGTNWVKI
jgi:hypothetical protein